MSKLGRKPYTPSHKDFLYKTYRGTILPLIPSSFGHQNLISNWLMLGNDSVGNCVFAGGDHETMLFTAEGSTQAVFSDATAIADYSTVTGYNPNNPNSDQGTDVRTAMQYRQSTGLVDVNGKRHKIGAYLLLDQSNLLNELLEATYLFSAVGIGINFPASAMDQFNNGQIWDVVKGSTIEGGHYVPILAYDGTYLYCVTWSKIQKMTVNFLLTYCEEAWAILSQEFLNGQGLSPEGFNLTQLQADLNALSGATPPSPTPTPVPPTPTLSSLSISPASASLKVGATQQEVIIAKYSDGSTQDVTSKCTWIASKTNIVTINNGIITAINAGTTTLTANYGGKSVTINVIVAKPTPVKKYKLEVKNLTKAQADNLAMFLEWDGYDVVEVQQK